MKRFLSTILMAAMALTLIPAFPETATAATGPWSWSDVSDYVTYRTNRPVWAIAHTNDGWFYTDGLDLWNGGQVYRFDGTTNVTVTMDVRNAGLSRVDDIVSDGADTVLFLQDVVRNDNNLRVVVNKNGTYYNITSVVRSKLDSDEGISSITGHNGSWMIITTKGRLFSWNANTMAPQERTLPYSLQTVIDNEMGSSQYRARMVYEPKNDNAITPISIQPMKNGSEWLLHVAYNEHTYTQSGSTGTTYDHKWYRVTSGNITQITSGLPTTYHAAMLGSNGDEVLILTSDLSSAYLSVYDGNTRMASVSIPGDAWPATDVAWNGESWLIVDAAKTVLRYDSEAAYSIADYATRDYFTSASGDDNGHFLLGGVVSEMSRSEPVYPMTAKLVLVTEDGGVSDGSATPTDTTYTNGHEFTDSGTGVKGWEWITPNVSNLDNGESTTYNVGAWDTDGIRRIEMYVNGELKRTCDYSDTHDNAACSYAVYADGYPKDTNIFMNAKIIDATDRFSWTEGFNVWRNNNDATNTDTTSEGSSESWVWLTPDSTTLREGEQVQFSVGAWDGDGIDRVTIYVNGTERRSCSFYDRIGNVECSYTLYASDYNNGDAIFVNARILDADGNMSWSNSKTVYRSNDGTTNNQSGTVHTTAWFDGDGTLDPGETFTFRTESYATDGLEDVTIYVNGSAVQTCDFTKAEGTLRCDRLISHDNQTDGTVIRAQSRARDVNGKTDWSEERTVVINTPSDNDSDDSDNDSESYALNVWDWVEPTVTSIALGERTRYHAGVWAEKGVKTVTLYVNGAAEKTCSYWPGTGNKDCWVELDAWNYPQDTDVFVNALVRDFKGQEKWTDGKTIHIEPSAGTNTESGGSAASISIWSDHDSGYSKYDRITLSAEGSDSDGIAQIEIYVNARLKKLCQKTSSCQISFTPYSDDEYVNYAATLVDTYGNVATTGYKQIERN